MEWASRYKPLDELIFTVLTQHTSDTNAEKAFEKLKDETQKLLSDYENKIDKSKKETKKIIDAAEKESEKAIIEKTKKFHQTIEEKKKNVEQKIAQMKENALKDIKNVSVRIAIKSVEKLIKNSIDKNKLENLYTKSLEQTKIALKQTRV
ncbi:MAG: ATPase [Candidatus Marinimicrobia bacterium]|nr:ATPase [Candidatus Neomarinimicrobiota bacterium]